MQFSLTDRTASLSVGEFADFVLGPRESGGQPQGLWRAQLGQHWHNEMRIRTTAELPGAVFEVPIEGRLLHRGWAVTLAGRLDQVLPASADPDRNCGAGSLTPPSSSPAFPAPRSAFSPATNTADPLPLIREIKTVTRPLPVDETQLRTDYGGYFLQLAAYLALSRLKHEPARGELVFVEVSSGLSQTVPLTAFDEALVVHQLDRIVEFLDQRLLSAERRRTLAFHPAFPSLRPGQETIQADLAAAFGEGEGRGVKIEGRGSKVDSPLPPLAPSPSDSAPRPPSSEFRTSPFDSPPSTFELRPSTSAPRPSPVLLLEAPTGYGKTGCVLEFALGRMRAGKFQRLVWLTGKSTGQLQVVHTLAQMTAPPTSNPLGYSAASPETDAEPSNNLLGHFAPLPVWQVRNKREHCVNSVFHCVRDACGFLAGASERWPQSGLSRFYLDPTQPRDLVTLRVAGSEARICPYEITRAALPFCDVWLGDYNYVFAPDNRGLFFDQPGFDPRETLLVIDEAHNLPSRVADAYSHAVRRDDSLALLAELDHLGAPSPLLLAIDQWTRLLGSATPGEELNPTLEEELREMIAGLAKLTTTLPLDYAALGPHHSETLWQFPALEGFLDDENLKKLLWCPRPGEINFTCIDATEAIGATLRSFGGAILMSATLAPYPEFAAACGLNPEGRSLLAGDPPTTAGNEPRLAGTVRPTCSILRAPAPWRDHAYDVAVDLRVDTSFKHRTGHYGTTAATIAALHASTNGPVAVFFPSYAYAEAVQRAGENAGSVLRIALQPRLSDLAAQTEWMEENLRFADALFLVLGGSFAEGIDVLGGRVTAAVVVGPALPEVNVVQKARLAAFEPLGREAAFRRVYQIPGLQKVNQALGRLVRAPGQRAKVLLHCRRFAELSYSSLLAPEYQFYREIASTADLQEWLATPPDAAR